MQKNEITYDEYIQDALRVAVEHLHLVGCANPDPFTLAMTVWEDEPPIPVPPKTVPAELQMRFQALHTKACRYLGVPAYAAKLSMLDFREEQLEAALEAFQFAAAAHKSHADALKAYRKAKFGDQTAR